MSIKTDLVFLLKNDIEVAKITKKIYPSVAPLLVSKPYIIYQIVALNHYNHLAGVSRLERVRVQIDIYASTSLSTDNLYKAVKNLLNGYKGELENCDIRHCVVDDGNDEFNDNKSGAQKGTHKKRIDFNIWFKLKR